MTDTTERATALVDRIINMPKSWVPIDGEVTNITFTTTESDLIVTALRSLAAQDQKPVAWRYELAASIGFCSEYLSWRWYLTEVKPDVPESSIRNLTPLYLSPPPAAGWNGSRWRHKKRGSTYTEIGRGKMQAENWLDPDIDVDYDSQRIDMAAVVIYRSDEDGSIWVRPVTEFEDGRFEALRHNAPPDSGAGKSEPADPDWRDDSTADELTGCREALRKEVIKTAKQAAQIADLNNMVLRYAHRAETNASAEARLREMLNGRDDFIVSKGLWSEFVETLPQHSPASDYDKQGETWCHCFDDRSREFCLDKDKCRPIAQAQTKSEGGTEGRARSTKADSARGEAGSAPSQDGSLAQLAAGINPGPSEPRGCPIPGAQADETDVTEEELAERIYNAVPAHTASSGRKIPWKELTSLTGYPYPTIVDGHRKEARALLDAFTVGRR